MATPWFDIGFEPPTYALGNLKDQDGWMIQIIGLGPFPQDAIVKNTSVITGTQSLLLQKAFVSDPQLITRYLKSIGSRTDYELRFKFHSLDVSNEWAIQIGFLSGSTGFAWSGGFQIEYTGLVTLLRAGDSQVLGQFDLTTAPVDFKIRLDAVPNIEAFVGGISQFFGSADSGVPGANLVVVHFPPMEGAGLVDFAAIDDLSADYNVTAIVPTSVIVDDFIVRRPAALPALKRPENAFAIRRSNYTVVSWDRVTELENGTKLENGVVRYDVYRFDNFNETDKFLKQSITTISLDHGDADNVFVDTNPGEHAYQIRAVAVQNGIMLESNLSERAGGKASPSQIDEKEELLDRKLFVLGEGRLGENLLA